MELGELEVAGCGGLGADRGLEGHMVVRDLPNELGRLAGLVPRGFARQMATGPTLSGQPTSTPRAAMSDHNATIRAHPRWNE